MFRPALTTLSMLHPSLGSEVGAAVPAVPQLDCFRSAALISSEHTSVSLHQRLGPLLHRQENRTAEACVVALQRGECVRVQPPVACL